MAKFLKYYKEFETIMIIRSRSQMSQNQSQIQTRFRFLQHRLQLEPSLQQLELYQLEQNLSFRLGQLLSFQLGQRRRQLEQPLLWRLLVP